MIFECPFFFFWSWKKYDSYPKWTHHFINEMLRGFSVFHLTIWNSLWLSCSKNGPHMKDGDHIFLFCSVSWGSERSILTVRDSQDGLANSALFVALFTLKQCFCIHAGVIVPLQLIGEGKWIFEHSWQEALSIWEDKSIKVIVFPHWINPADLVKSITQRSGKTMSTMQRWKNLSKPLFYSKFSFPLLSPLITEALW